MTRPTSHVSRFTPLLVLLAYVLLAVAMTWPVAAQLGTHLPGGADDLWVHRWTFWWVKRSITQGHSPFYTDLLFYPQGASLTTHNIAWLNIAAWLPLQAILGGNAAYSTIFIVTFALNGFATYLLAREITGSLPAAFVGGLVYGFWPYTLSHYGHPNMMVTCWIPLALLYLQRTLDQGKKRDALLTALFLALAGLTRWQMLVMGGLLVSLYLLYRFLKKSCRTRHNLGLLVLIGLVAGTLMLPLAAPVALAHLTRPHPEDLFVDDQTQGQTDLLAYVLPGRNHPLWSDAAFQIYQNFVDNKVYVAFLGYTTIALACYAIVRNWKQARFWLLAVIMYVALALGPRLRINGQLYPQVPMPYRLVGDLSFIQLLRKPDRFNVLLGLPIGMLASVGTAALLRHPLFGRKPALLVIVTGALILREYSLVPYPTASPITPAWYRRLAQEPGDFAVLDLPMRPETFDKHFMFYQITHGKPLVEGHVSRPPREAFIFIDSVPFLNHLRQDNQMHPALVDISHQLQMLAEANVRYVILHKSLTSAEQLAAWQDWLTFEPLHQDTDMVVYSTDPQLGSDFSLAYDLTDEIGLIRATFTPTTTIQGALIQVDARWGSIASPQQDYDVCLNLVNASGRVSQSYCEPLSPTWPPPRWEAEEIVRSEHTLHVAPSLQPEIYSLTLTLTDGATGATTGDSAILGLIRVEPLQPTHPLHALWGNVILLHGYDLRQSAGSLELTLYWQAQQRMDISYKVFAHLIDLTTRAVVVQDDAVPRHWTYPTTGWERGEVVEDTISLPLDSVPSGEYLLVVGLYNPTTGERLPVYAADGERYPDDATPLTTIRH
ncbi:MAG: glycosyltransferase family 39 protein [Chloroflexota bacterium]|nr:glycosyltransferase family 39 protein [Chloroflexota bacterium]